MPARLPRTHLKNECLGCNKKERNISCFVRFYYYVWLQQDLSYVSQLINYLAFHTSELKTEDYQKNLFAHIHYRPLLFMQHIVDLLHNFLGDLVDVLCSFEGFVF